MGTGISKNEILTFFEKMKKNKNIKIIKFSKVDILFLKNKSCE